jgi:hypothetical protein
MPGQVRGISPLTPALQVARQFDQLSDATLTAAILQTVFAASITSEEPTEEVLNGLLTPQEQARLAATGVSPWDAYIQAQSGWYDTATINLGINGRIAHLFPGQKLELHRAHPHSDYCDFAAHLPRRRGAWASLRKRHRRLHQRDLPACAWRPARSSRSRYTAAPCHRALCNAVYEAWLEEEIARGGIPSRGPPASLPIARPRPGDLAGCAEAAGRRSQDREGARDLVPPRRHDRRRDCRGLGYDIERLRPARPRKAMRETYGLPDAQHQGITTAR